MNKNDRPEYVFFVESMVASKTGEPAVIVTVNGADFTVNMTTETAKDLAANLLNAVASAENDAFFFDYLRKNLGLSERAVVATLVDFRKWKEERITQ